MDTHPHRPVSPPDPPSPASDGAMGTPTTVFEKQKNAKLTLGQPFFQANRRLAVRLLTEDGETL